MRGSFSKSARKIEMCPAPFSNLSVIFWLFFAETENEKDAICPKLFRLKTGQKPSLPFTLPGERRTG